MDILKIRDAADVEAAVRAAIASEQPLEIIGHGTRRNIGHAMDTNAVLDLSALNAVVDYEPSELVLTVQAGAPLDDVQSLIDGRNQELTFEPVDLSALLGTSGAGTIGGMIGAGFAGPRRIKAGSVRDHLLGAQAVSGFGDSFKAGGRVVKNVTGYDMCKLLAGSWGTLAVMTEVTLKVMPRAESVKTLVLRGLDDETANHAMTVALGSSFDISGAAHIPASVCRISEGPLVGLAADKAVTLLRLEGIAASVDDRAVSVARLMEPFGGVEIAGDDVSVELWKTVCDVLPFARAGVRGDALVWRIVCPPASGGALGQTLVREVGAEVIYDWAGGLIWAAVPASVDRSADLRKHVAAYQGHATLIRASDDVRATVPVFPPQDAGLAALGERVRHSFDPKAILNRGRMTQGQTR